MQRSSGPPPGVPRAAADRPGRAAGLGERADRWTLRLTWRTALHASSRASGERMGPSSWVTPHAPRWRSASRAASIFAHDTRRAACDLALSHRLDAVDGGWRVAPVGDCAWARFDGEVDAFLTSPQRLHAPACGAWVLAIGAARYLSSRRVLLPWDARAPAPRNCQDRRSDTGGRVTVAAPVLPLALTRPPVAALALLTASMGQCTWWLWRRRHAAHHQVPVGDVGQPHGRPLRTGFALAVTVLALLLVWAALVAPNEPSRFTLGEFVRLPLELLVVVAVAAVLPVTARRVLAVVAGAVLSLLVLVKVLDIGFFTAFDRPFKPIDDSGYVGIGIETLRHAIGGSSTNLVVAVAAVLIVASCRPLLALLRVTRVAAGHRGWALDGHGAGCLGALRVVGAPVASRAPPPWPSTRCGCAAGLADHAALAREIAHDRFRATPATAADRPAGKTSFSCSSRATGGSRSRARLLAASTSRSSGAPRAAGRRLLLAQRLLTSPTFAASAGWRFTLQSGVVVDGHGVRPARPERAPTLTRAFKRAGGGRSARCRGTAGVARGLDFYHYDKVYDRRNLGYRGPGFGLPPMPDQYTLLALQRRELAKRHRPPLFAEVDLISSHAPWTRIPRLISWDEVGDGSIFDRLPAEESTKASLFGDAQRAAPPTGTRSSIAEHHLLVRAELRRRQPGARRTGRPSAATVVTGQWRKHDVPVSVIAPTQGDRPIAGWSWQGRHSRARGRRLAYGRVP